MPSCYHSASRVFLSSSFLLFTEPLPYRNILFTLFSSIYIFLLFAPCFIFPLLCHQLFSFLSYLVTHSFVPSSFGVLPFTPGGSHVLCVGTETCHTLHSYDNVCVVRFVRDPFSGFACTPVAAHDTVGALRLFLHSHFVFLFMRGSHSSNSKSVRLAAADCFDYTSARRERLDKLPLWGLKTSAFADKTIPFLELFNDVQRT